MHDRQSGTSLHREDIKAAIRKRFGTLTAYAESKGVSVSALSHYLSGRADSRSLRIEEEIAYDLGFTLEEVQSVTRPEVVDKPRVAEERATRTPTRTPKAVKQPGIASPSSNDANTA